MRESPCVHHTHSDPYMWFLISVLVHCSFSVYFTLFISSFIVTDVNSNSFCNVKRTFAINPSVPCPQVGYWARDLFLFLETDGATCTAQKRADT